MSDQPKPTTDEKEPASLIAYRSDQDTKAAAELDDIRKRVQQDIEQHNKPTTGEQDNKSLVTLDLWIERNFQWSQRLPKGVLEDLVFCLEASHNAALTAEREKHESELHQLAILLEGNPYSDPDFMPDNRALKAAVKLLKSNQQLREQLAAAQAAICDHNTHASTAGFRIPYSDTTALDAAIAGARTEQARDDRKTYELRLKNGIAAAQQSLVELLQKVDTMMYRHIGDDKLREEIKAQLAKVKEGK